jgi:hypothetical protein
MSSPVISVLFPFTLIVLDVAAVEKRLTRKLSRDGIKQLTDSPDGREN